jgi:hypothetical protein
MLTWASDAVFKVRLVHSDRDAPDRERVGRWMRLPAFLTANHSVPRWYIVSGSTHPR